MAEVSYIQEKEADDDEYENVAFNDFCDKTKTSTSDLLTLNDNINYRLYYENDKLPKLDHSGDTSNEDADQLRETSLCGSKNTPPNKSSASFAPFGKHNANAGKSSLFSGVIPKSRSDGELSLHSREPRYERFSRRHNFYQTICDYFPGFGSSILLFAIIIALCLLVWWLVCNALGGSWGEEHYKKLWEKAHPEDIKKPLTPIAYDKSLLEHRYHDHNNLSSKNKNTTETTKKKSELNKKNVYTTDELKGMCAKVEDSMRFDCYPQDGANEKDCIKRGCCWKVAVTKGAPYCFYPAKYDSFGFLNMTENKHGMTVFYEKVRPSGYPDDFDIVQMNIRYLSNDILQIKLYDAKNRRFEPPYPETPIGPSSISRLQYRVQVDGGTVGFKVIRNADNVTIVNTQDVGGWILSDKLLQISSILPTDHIFGLGERRSRFMVDMNWQTIGLFNHDTPPMDNTNLYGTHPFYLAVESTGMSHGMFLLNSNAMDVVLQPTPAITYRTVGGILNLFIMLGPSPGEVVSQYTSIVGRPFMPPYWALGFHLCKFNYGSLNITRDVWQKNREAGLPFDVQWNDLDYMNNSNDFTYDKLNFAGLPDFVSRIHSEGMHYVVLIDPGVSASEQHGAYPPYDRGMELDVFIKNSTKMPFVGKVWNKGSTVFPDFTHPSSTTYWVEMLTSLHNEMPFDGAWIDMNEPSNFLSGPMYGSCKPENLAYRPHVAGNVGLRYKTLCMDAVHYAGLHRDWHNLYSLTESIATHFSLMEVRGRRPFVISRSTFAGSGRYAGHWSGDIASDWRDMRMTIPELLSFSIFGIPMMGADICGFRGNTTVELCKRWMQLGAFYPFSRNHNSDTSIPQDPASLGPDVMEASIRALRTRYRLLPYYYTLFWKAHTYGDTVARPIFFECPEQTNLHNIDNQFMLGSYIMITPILKEGVSSTKAFFPGKQPWYNFRDGQYITTNGWQEILENDTVSIKGGGIVPLQEPLERGPVTTSGTRSRPLQLMVAPDSSGAAYGEIYWDDGDGLNSYQEKVYSHIVFTLKSMQITSRIVWWGYGLPFLDKITVLSVIKPVSKVYLNGALCDKPKCQFVYFERNKSLVLNVSLPLDKTFNVTWSHDAVI